MQHRAVVVRRRVVLTRGCCAAPQAAPVEA